MPNPINIAHSLGQSIWYDNIERKLIKEGKLSRLIEDGQIYGITSNPSIFQKAIAASNDYDKQMQPLAWSGLSADEIFYELAVQDIQDTADLFADMYHSSNKVDGYVSLEVNPLLALDTEGTIEEAKKLWKKVDRKNLMVKIPATKEGIPAIRHAIASGINVNVTLIFSIERYKEVIKAYMSGLEDRVQAGLPIDEIASVASFFVSRVDTKVDQIIALLVENGDIDPSTANQIMGKAAIANSRLAYRLFLEQFASKRFTQLKAFNARVQRPLWASTSTKNPAYSDVLYVEELIVPHSVNTIPPATLDAFIEHGEAKLHTPESKHILQDLIDQLERLGIEMQKVTEELEQEGVKAFSDAYLSLLETIERRRTDFIAELGDLKTQVASGVKWHKQNRTIQKMFDRDPSLWADEPTKKSEIIDRLGWLDLPNLMAEELVGITEIAHECQNENFSYAVLLGMGGSSLAPEVFSKVFYQGRHDRQPALDLLILDSTDPDEILNTMTQLDLKKSLFIVSSKSGTTTETISLMDFFFEKLKEQGINEPGKHFIAITDPGTPLAVAAEKLEFRIILSANPEVGGRYSAFSVFGLFPAALIGIDLFALNKVALDTWQKSFPAYPYHANLGLLLGIILGEAHNLGKNKLTIFSDREYEPFGAWLEQLLAESTGKGGKGIIPIDVEPIYLPEDYYQDRIFIYIKGNGEKEPQFNKIKERGFTAITLQFSDDYELISQFYTWEIATSIACSIIHVNPFDQPNVQESKDRTLEKIEEFHKNGKFKLKTSVWENDDFQIRLANINLDVNTLSPQDIFKTFFRQMDKNGFIALNAFMNKSINYQKQFQRIRKSITKNYKIATTLGYGPRYLHSTGQLHKGGPRDAFFIVFTRGYKTHLSIPKKNYCFEDLILAQALGDLDALSIKGNKVIHIHIKNENIENALQQIYQYILPSD